MQLFERICNYPERATTLTPVERVELEIRCKQIIKAGGLPIMSLPQSNGDYKTTFLIEYVDYAKTVLSILKPQPPEKNEKPILYHAQVALVGFYRGLNLRYSKHATFIDENYRALLTEFKHEPTRGAIGKNYNDYFSKIAIDKEGRIIGIGKFGYKKTINDIEAVLPHLTETQKEAAKKDIAKLEELKEKEPK